MSLPHFRVLVAGLVCVALLGGAFSVFAANTTVETTARVDVRVWRSVANPEHLYLSTRPGDGSWTTHSTPLDMSAVSASGRWHQSSIVTVDIPVIVTVTVETSDTSTDSPSVTVPETEEPAWCDDRPSWSGAAIGLLSGATGFYSLDPIGSHGHRDHVLPWSFLCELVTSESAARAAYNDTRNLVPTVASFNLSKSDDLAHEWLPRWRTLDAAGYTANACAYATRYRSTATRYGHALSVAEDRALTDACAATESDETEDGDTTIEADGYWHAHCARNRVSGGCDRRYRPIYYPNHYHPNSVPRHTEGEHEDD
ncbi:MAG: hypothetical protein OXG19_05605 [Chloroflexi bacterium]|nr:hypothetical protein [Chloroflexota bacterium]